MAALIYIASQVYKGSLFTTSSPILTSCIFDNSHSNRCEVISWFWFAFSRWVIVWAPLHVSVDHLYAFFGKITLQILCPFFNKIFLLLLSCMSLLHILGINPLPAMWPANTLSHSVGCRFIWLMVSFAVQKLCGLLSSHLLILPLLPLLLVLKDVTSEVRYTKTMVSVLGTLSCCLGSFTLGKPVARLWSSPVKWT